MGLFDKIKAGLTKTRDAVASRVDSIIKTFTPLNDEFFEELEEALILADLGVQTAVGIKSLETEEVTKGGIVLPGSAKEKPQMAEVLAVGPGGVVDGKEVTMYVNVGDKVIYSKYAGTEVKLDGTEYIVVRQNDILAVVE